MECQEGAIIRLRAFGGKIIKRRVVSVSENFVLICKEKEYKNAQRKKREPVCVGFPKSDIIDESMEMVGEKE